MAKNNPVKKDAKSILKALYDGKPLTEVASDVYWRVVIVSHNEGKCYYQVTRNNGESRLYSEENFQKLMNRIGGGWVILPERDEEE